MPSCAVRNKPLDNTESVNYCFVIEGRIVPKRRPTVGRRYFNAHRSPNDPCPTRLCSCSHQPEPRAVAGSGEVVGSGEEGDEAEVNSAASVRNCTGFTWNKRREQAAGLVADDRLTDDEIAAAAGVTRQALVLWKRNPVFIARVDELIEAARAAVKAEGIANKRNRIAALNDRWLKGHQVISERGADPEMDGVPGGRTGLLVHTYRIVGTGPSQQALDEYAVDTGLLKELREHEKQAAIELHEWDEAPTAGVGQGIAVRVLVGVQVEHI